MVQARVLVMLTNKSLVWRDTRIEVVPEAVRPTVPSVIPARAGRESATH
jgi:hypothetical protein